MYYHAVRYLFASLAAAGLVWRAFEGPVTTPWFRITSPISLESLFLFGLLAIYSEKR